jgi:putative endonuclease
MERQFYVYILANRRNGTLYTGITGFLARRVWQHREGEGSAFAKKYDVRMLVWYAVFETAHEAIRFEKQVKRWRRAWKLALIERLNPQWLDLYETLNC